ncbi:MAG: glucans biosynthesis glucosyltransferase MdoH [Verrucomicrobiaceae bacterium]|nr:glucans biosynthesis glucosyltransferase MdoH [Verrucomicrobiaceae bacterium]
MTPPAKTTPSTNGFPPPRLASARRATFFVLVLLGTGLGTWLMSTFVAADGKWRWAEIGLLLTFVPLYYQLNCGFWTALIGVWLQNQAKSDPTDLWQTISHEPADAPLTASTAIVIPVYNEDVTRVWEGLRVTYQSLVKTGQIQHFDFFVLSDSDDTNKWIEEETAWLELSRQLGAFGKIFYRKRRKPINRKSGNVSDFCRRWGKRYRYMIVFDADSLMSGSLMVAMTRIMENNPRVGILQTFPKQVASETLLGRLMQFAQSLYGPAFMAGLNYWQNGEANFWGHNAIIRLEPFINHCALPPLPKTVPFGGHILSHDFVEAALMRKAGYAVRLLNTNRGSYEEGPPSLIDTLKRDRRWCQGNMQHFWLLFAKGWHPMSRFNFGHGVLSYVSSPLWLLFLIFSTVLAKFPDPDRLPPAVNAGQLLLVLTGVLIFMPKTVILLDELFTGRLFKPWKLRIMTFIGSLMDTLIFTLMAPVMMWFHSKFVFKIVLGQGVKWVAQRRKLEGVDWREAILTFGEVTLLGLAWGAISWWVGSTFMLWMAPIVVSMVLAIPIAIWLGSGQSGLRWGLFLTPEELEPPSVLSDLQDNLAEVKGRIQMPPEIEKSYGLMQVCLDPYVNGLHVSLLRRRNVKDTREYLDEIAERLVKTGPQGMKPVEINAIMNDADTVTALHHRLWAAGEEELAPFWSLAIKQYNLAATHPFAHLLANKETVPQAT